MSRSAKYQPHSRLRGERIGALLIAACAAAYAAFAFREYPIGSAIAPVLAGGTTAALALLIVGRSYLFDAPGEPSTNGTQAEPLIAKPQGGNTPSDGPGLWGISLWLIAAAALILLFGVLPAAMVFVAAYLRIEGGWSLWRAGATGALTAVSLAILMQWLMGARLQGGIVFGLFPV
ncbi:MAG: hypothetical protein LJE62_13260 [Silicimonas sp.]|nr:hypothetical protein [Silicimonas sp.]